MIEIEGVRDSIFKSEMVIAHGNYSAKCQFCCWSLLIKVIFIGFMLH